MSRSPNTRSRRGDATPTSGAGAERIFEAAQITRRDFLATSASGLGTLALASLFAQNGLLSTAHAGTGPMTIRQPHFAPRAKACICIYMEGAPSQMDLFDPKPKLLELD